MLKDLSVKGAGPAALGGELRFGPLGDRFNVVAGDNGLGKSFLLELCWWALTRTWSKDPVMPYQADAWVRFAFDSGGRTHEARCDWHPNRQEWTRKAGRPPNSSVVVYAAVDGAFSVWDPAKNYRVSANRSGGKVEAPSAYLFTSDEVLHGPADKKVCQGMLADWREWQISEDPRFRLFSAMLTALSPDPDHALVPGKLQRRSVDDTTRYPSVQMPWGHDVAVDHASAGVLRTAKLAYMLTWALSEHQYAADELGLPRADRVILLLDEPETHLHPRWQRTLLPALLAAVQAWSEAAPLQVITTTHSPLVLASLEPSFDPAQDKVWTLDLDLPTTPGGPRPVALRQLAWQAHGDANRWLTSEVFDLKSATSTEAERAIAAATVLMSGPEPSTEQLLAATTALRASGLPELDPFFARWRFVLDRRGLLPDSP